MKTKLNDLGLKKIVEWLDKEVPGIGSRFVIKDGKLVIDGVAELIAVVESAPIAPEIVANIKKAAADFAGPKAAADILMKMNNL